jgi:hypothetical protein
MISQFCLPSKSWRAPLGFGQRSTLLFVARNSLWSSGEIIVSRMMESLGTLPRVAQLRGYGVCAISL